jgi:phenylpropionate dioxygenase-like ring-hydroxylating dioxygenase large terminal subunit
MIDMTVTESGKRQSEDGSGDQLAIGPNPPELQARVPHAMTDANFVPKERYFSRDFFELEKLYLWPHAWQMAARLEEIPRPGDFVEYEVAGNSVLIVRQRDGSVKALHNACRHRATELARGCGRFPGGQIVCPFHGWRWNLDGSSSLIFVESGFDPECLKPEDVRLQECQVDVWAGMVWINIDPTARPLHAALAPVADLLDSIGVGNMRVKWWKQVVLNANWKIVQEAFLEGYHVMQTHPQLVPGGDLEVAAAQSLGTEYTAFRNGHGRFQSGIGLGDRKLTGMDGDSFVEFNRLLADGQDAMALDRDVEIFQGIRNKVGVDNPNYAAEAIQALYDHAAGAGIPMAPMSDNMRLWGGEIFMFPNFFMLPMYGNCLSYRMRPIRDDPEWTLFDVWSLTTYPVGHEPERAELLGIFDKEDKEHWGLIPRQDFSNIERQQRGLHSVSLKHTRLSPVFEKTILNLHQELDRVLAGQGQSSSE